MASDVGGFGPSIRIKQTYSIVGISTGVVYFNYETKQQKLGSLQNKIGSRTPKIGSRIALQERS